MEAKKWKMENPNRIGDDGHLIVEQFDKDKFKEWAMEQIGYLQVRVISDVVLGQRIVEHQLICFLSDHDR
jgi:hypothetical protein